MSYVELEGLRQSNLKKLLISPKSYLSAIKKQENSNNDEETPEHFVFGSVLDLLLKGKREEFEKKYVRIPDSIRISVTIQKIIKAVFKEVEYNEEIKDLSFYQSNILKYAKIEGYGQAKSEGGKKWGNETVVARVIKEGTEGFTWLSKMKVKTPIKESDYNNAVNCKMALTMDTYTKVFVDPKLNPNMKFIDDVVVQFAYKGEKIKIEIDRVAIDHEKKLIHPIDFKFTGKPIHNFIRDFWFYRYDFQAGTYKHGLFDHPNIIKLIKDGYIVKEFLYIVVEKALINNPIIFRVPSTVSLIGIEGGTLSDGTKLEGLSQAINRYKFHTKENKWEYPMEYYNNKGVQDITI